MVDDTEKMVERMRKMTREIENIFYSLIGPRHPVRLISGNRWQPYTDIYELDDKVVIKMELAGVSKDDISINGEHNYLIVSGIRKEKPPESFKNYNQVEINYGEFDRTLILPEGAKMDKVTAEYKDGFLIITVPKTRKVKKIKIEEE